jgi:hypothetical protein
MDQGLLLTHRVGQGRTSSHGGRGICGTRGNVKSVSYGGVEIRNETNPPPLRQLYIIPSIIYVCMDCPTGVIGANRLNPLRDLQKIQRLLRRLS